MTNLYKMLSVMLLLTGLSKAQAQAPTRISEDFNTSLVPTGWTNSLNSGALISRVTTVQSFGRTGTVAAVQANNYNVANGNRAQLETPIFTVPTVSGDSLRFDIAHATYSTVEHDSLIILAFDGVSYNRIAAWGSSATIDLTGITTAAAQTAAFVPTSAQWLTKKLALPVGTTGVRFEFYSDFGNQMYIDRVIVDSFYVAPMVYNSSTTTQSSVATVFNGAINQQIIGITVNVSGNQSPLDVTNFDLNTALSNNAVATFDSAKVFYTGSVNAFSATGRFGQIANPNGLFSITGTQTLGDGNNYFWLVYDIKPAVTFGDTVDAECSSITIGGIPQTPTVVNPTGVRQIDVATSISVTASSGTPYNTYSSLKAVFDNINGGYHNGDIQIRINSNLTETASARLDSSGAPSGASYTSISIRPADTTTVTKTITNATGAIALIELNGADNITIDGRAMGTGSTSLLQLVSTSTTAGTVNMRLTNGAQNNTVTYLNSLCALNATSNTITHLAFTAGSVPVGNANNTFSFNFFNQGSRGVTLDGVAGAFSSGNLFYHNTIQNFKTFGFQLSTGILSVDIDSNVITHADTYNSTETAGMYGIDLNFLVDNSTINITRNTISNLSTTAVSTSVALRGIRIVPQTATVNAAINIYNNAIALTRTNAGITGNQVFRGIDFQGTQPAVVKVIQNSVLIGGTNTVAGVVNSVGIFKTNSSATSTFIALNNISKNIRTSTSGFNAASWVSSLAGTIQVDYNVYYTNPGNYTTLWFNGTNSTIYTTTTAYRTGVNVAPNEQHSFIGDVTFTSGTDLTLSGTSVNDYLLLGAPLNGSALNDILGTIRANPTYKGAHQATPFTNLKDAAVKEVYTLGKLPIPYAVPHSIRAAIVNEGVDTLFNQQADVNVTGANTFTDTQIIDTILPGQLKYVSFNAFTYMNTGTCLVTVTVPNDSTNTNNSKSFNQVVTTDVYAYADPTLPAIGGVGFNGIGGDFIAKFPYTGSNSINQVGVTFNTGGQPYQIVIYDMLNDTPGILLWHSATQTSVIGNNTVPVIPAIAISGSFFVGVRQTGLVNVGFGYQAEDPIRNQTFYYKATSVANWNDFATTNSAFRFMVEPRLQVADDIGPESVVLPCQRVALGSPAFSPAVKVLNYGINTRDTFSVSYEITGPVNSSGSGNFGLVGLVSSQSVMVGLPTLFTPSIAGLYTIKTWTQILDATDLGTGNDTMISTFEVVDVNTATDGGNKLTLNGTNQYGSANGAGNLNITGSMLTIETWVKQALMGGNRFIVNKDNELSSSGYSLLINASGNVVFRLTTINGLDSLVSTATVPFGLFTHVAATYDGTLGEARIYINGEESGFKVIFLPIIGNTSALYIGRSATGDYLDGDLDELKIWDTTRTATQIRNGLHTRQGNFAHPNLKAYWRMDELSGSIIADASGNCNAASLDNGGIFAASEIPLGAPALYYEPVFASGAVPFTGSDMSMMIYNQSGSNEYYVHKFAGAPAGTQPSFIPGGVTNVHANNWIVYRYGTGTMDSSEATFYTNGITMAADPNDFFLFKRTTGSIAGWTQITSASMADPNTGMVTFRTLATDYHSQLSIGANNNSLPVQLLSFKAIRQNTDARVIWTTASEFENAGFDIQRSTDGKTFTTIGSVKGNGTKSTLSEYGFTDARVFADLKVSTLYYRLAQKDLSGRITLSAIVNVQSTNPMVSGENIFPNPFTDLLYIETNAKAGSQLQVKITDIQGQVIQQTSLTVQASGIAEISEWANLPKGIYFIHTLTQQGNSVHKVFKQ